MFPLLCYDTTEQIIFRMVRGTWWYVLTMDLMRFMESTVVRVTAFRGFLTMNALIYKSDVAVLLIRLFATDSLVDYFSTWFVCELICVSVRLVLAPWLAVGAK